MEKSILVRRKAQKLAREGRTGEAIEQLRQLDSEAEVDPYDHVFIGDLLLRQGHREEAVEALLEAVNSYRRVGLNRSAIAICKKILRLGDPTALVSLTLGDLYLSEELHTEAVQHLLRYLDGIPPDTSPPEEFFETLDKVASISGLQVEAALRLSDHFQRVRREDRAAELLERVADQAGAVGIAGDLREKARQLHAQFVARSSSDCEAGSPPESPPGVEDELIPTASDLSSPEAACVPDDDLVLDIGLDDLIGEAHTGGLETGGFEVEHFPVSAAGEPDSSGQLTDEELPESDAGAPALADWRFSDDPVGASRDGQGDGDRVPHEDVMGRGEPEPDGDGWESDGVDDVSVIDLDEDNAVVIDMGEDGGVVIDLDEDDEVVVDLDEDAAVLIDQGEGDGAATDIGEDAESHRRLIGQAAAAFGSEDWNQARACYEKLHLANPLDRTILEPLLAVVRRMRDPAGEVRCLIQLGDAFIAEEDYEKALEAFIDVVRLDPDNSTGRRRLIRFREMGVIGADQGPEEGSRGGWAPEDAADAAEELLPGVLESGSTSVTVSSEPARTSDEWVDLGALLEEFKSGLQNQIDGDDFQSHYDLAVSHRTMGLHTEAMEELDSILGNTKLPASMAWICRELRGACLADMGRHADAIEELRRTLELPVDDEQKRWSVLYNLARVMESAGEWREAEETYERLIAEAPGFLDARQRREHCRERRDPGSRAA